MVYPYPIIDGKSLRLHVISTSRALDNGALIYIPHIQNYYHGLGGFDEKYDLGKTGIAREVMKNSPAVLEFYDKYANLYIKGRKSKSTFTIYGTGFFLQDSITNTGFLVNNFDRQQHFYKPEIKEGNTYVYGRDLEKKVDVIYYNGKPIDYSKMTKYKYTKEGHPVLMIENKPVAIFSGYFDVTKKSLHYGKIYNNEALYTNPPSKESSTNLSSEAAEFIEFYKTKKEYDNRMYYGKLAKDMIASGKSTAQINQYFHAIFSELYPQSKKYGYEFMMIVPNNYVQGISQLMTPSQRENIRAMGRAELSKYRVKQ